MILICMKEIKQKKIELISMFSLNTRRLEVGGLEQAQMQVNLFYVKLLFI